MYIIRLPDLIPLKGGLTHKVTSTPSVFVIRHFTIMDIVSSVGYIVLIR